MKKMITILCLAVCLLTAGCNKNPKQPSVPDNTDPANTNVSQPFDWQNGLEPTRQLLDSEGKMLAVAYLGFCGARADVLEHIKNNCKRFNDNYGFLNRIPDSRIIGDGGQLYLVVGNTETDVAVNLLAEDGSTAEVLFKGDLSEPIMVFANNGAFMPDTQIVTIDTSFAPCLDYNGRLTKSDTALDISNYHDIAEQTYAMASEGAWDKPTKEMLVNTSWMASRYINEYETEQYSLDFFEDTVKIVWNEGIGEFTAKWSLSEKDDVTILTIDLENLDGLRSYAVLLSPDMMSITADFTSNSEIRSYEAINTLFEKTVG